MVDRIVKLLEKNSFFLFGARGTGKSTFLKTHFPSPKTRWIDLLDDAILDHYLINPQALKEELTALSQEKRPDWVVLDEIQKAPKLLNTVHQLIELKLGIKFAMTGSSARRLKQRGVNLLAGRAFVENLFPFTARELGGLFNLSEVLAWGSLPKLLQLESVEEKEAYLRSYTLTYIKSEVQEEQWVRNLDPFRKFLPIAAQMNAQPLNFTSIGKDAGVNSVTVKSYFEILEDTLLGFFVPPYHRSIRKQQRTAPKFYFFDLGVKRALERRLSVPLATGTSEYGNAFEHFVVCEIYRLNHYLRKDFELAYLLTKDNVEIDLIIDRPGKKTALIEIKSAERVDERHTRQLEGIFASTKNSEAFLFSLDPTPRRIRNVLALPWNEGLEVLFGR